jgi:hypothetical protein
MMGSWMTDLSGGAVITPLTSHTPQVTSIKVVGSISDVEPPETTIERCPSRRLGLRLHIFEPSS